MAELNPGKIKKLKSGERAGLCALVAGGAAALYFVAIVIAAMALNDDTLKLVAWASGPASVALFAGVAAFCYFKYSRPLEREISKYVLSSLMENAAKLHPDRNNLTYLIAIYDDRLELTANDYKKDVITLDFSAFKRLTLSKKSAVCKEVTDRLCITFIRLLERGGEYKTVDYVQRYVGKNRTGKKVPIITDGAPDKAALKIYRRR